MNPRHHGSSRMRKKVGAIDLEMVGDRCDGNYAAFKGQVCAQDLVNEKASRDCACIRSRRRKFSSSLSGNSQSDHI